jgi:D-citramalate synthase
VLERIIELGDRKSTISPEDLPYIIADVLKRPDERVVRIEDWRVLVSNTELPHAEVSVSFHREVEKAEASGDGGYDALMNALKKAVRRFDIEVPRLADFRVRIPPGGRTGALVETAITWHTVAGTVKGPHGHEDTFSTIGVDSDQMGAAVIATEKMLNAVATRPKAGRKTPRKNPRRVGA